MKMAQIAVLAAVALIGSAASAVDEHHIVRPGEGIGVIKLGMTVKDVHDAMAAWGTEPLLKGKSGGPGAWVDKQAVCIIEAYQADSIGHGLWAGEMKVFYVNNAVAQIAVHGSAYVTTKGAMSRNTSSEFRAVHPSLHAIAANVTWSGRIRAYDSESQGLAVTYPVIRRDTELRTAQEILVHKRGVPMIVESPRAETKPDKPVDKDTK
jgi:hypothetical protein